MEKPHQCSNDMYDLMRACWNQLPEHRPTFAKIVEYLDSFLTQANPDVSFDPSHLLGTLTTRSSAWPVLNLYLPF